LVTIIGAKKVQVPVTGDFFYSNQFQPSAPWMGLKFGRPLADKRFDARRVLNQPPWPPVRSAPDQRIGKN
jgi:hypothetical protein